MSIESTNLFLNRLNRYFNKRAAINSNRNYELNYSNKNKKKKSYKSRLEF